MCETKTDDIVERRKLGKLGMKEQPLVGQILIPVETNRYRALAATAKFLAIDRGDIVSCAKELTRHVATPTTTDWEKLVRLGRYLKNRPRVRLWYKFQESLCQLETLLRYGLGRLQKNTSQYHRRIHSCRVSSHQKCGANHKLLWLSVQRKPNCTASWERRRKQWDSSRCTKISAHT